MDPYRQAAREIHETFAGDLFWMGSWWVLTLSGMDPTHQECPTCNTIEKIIRHYVKHNEKDT